MPRVSCEARARVWDQGGGVMTAVAEEADKETTEDVGGPSEAQLLDVLYEVLAQGAQPLGSKTVEAIQQFLHQHARNRKPLPEILAFFTQHGLPTDASAYGADPALSELAAGFLRERPPISASFALDGGAAGHGSGAHAASLPPVAVPPMATSSQPIVAEPSASRRVETVELDVIEGEHTSPRSMVVPALGGGGPSSFHGPATLRNPAVWIAGLSGGLACVLGLLAFSSHRDATKLEEKLNEARLQQRTTDVALTSLEQRAETLKAALEQSETARRSLALRFDDFIAREAQARAAESTALERVLGRRFELARDRALAESLRSGEH
jgi:hypothetical protein